NMADALSAERMREGVVRRERPEPAVAARGALRHDAGEADAAVVLAVCDPCQLRPLPRHRGVVDLRQRLRVAEPAGDVPRLPRAPDSADSAVERAVVEERVPVHRRAEAVEELPRLAELPIPGGLGVVGGCSLDVGPEPAPVQLAPELVRLARPVDAGRVRTRHGRAVVARPARAL